MLGILTVLKWLFFWPWILSYRALSWVFGWKSQVAGLNKMGMTENRYDFSKTLAPVRDIPSPTQSESSAKSVYQDKEKQMDSFITPLHSLMLVNIAKSVADKRKIYDATRFSWKINSSRAEKVDYVLGHNGKRVIGVFKPLMWCQASDQIFSTLPGYDVSSERWGFEGEVAESEILELYFNRLLPDDFSVRGAANPVRFLEPEGVNKSNEVPVVESKANEKMRYIAGEDGAVSSIVIYEQIETSRGEEILGAYYGYAGGGDNDGGYFRINFENSVFEHLDYGELENLQEIEPETASRLESLMQYIWSLVSDDDEELVLTQEGQEVFDPDDDGVWMDDAFDGDALEEVSNLWAISLRFEG